METLFFRAFFGLIITILAIVGLWKLYQKADEPGWAAIIPIYNTWVMARIAGINPIMIILLVIPLVNVIFGLVLAFRFVDSFGIGFGGFMMFILLNPIMLIYMGFSSDVSYTGQNY